jgi:hypothetical protein
MRNKAVLVLITVLVLVRLFYLDFVTLIATFLTSTNKLHVAGAASGGLDGRGEQHWVLHCERKHGHAHGGIQGRWQR